MLGSLLREDRVILNLEVQDKWEAIRRLAETFRGSQEILDFPKFLEDVKEREALQTTGVGDAVALPHARSASVKSLIVAVGVTRFPLEFEALDGQPVRLVFLMGVPNEDAAQYIKLLAYLAKTVCKPELRDRLTEAPNAASLIEVLRAVEGVNG